MFFVKNPKTYFFEGVVEDRNDPLKAGRVRVRVFGKHTDDKSEISTSDLFWALVVMPVTSASTSGVSETPFLVEGSHVVGYFRDGPISQDPVILGTILGIPIKKSNPGVGFNDPNGKYPKWTEEPDLPRLAREKTEGTIQEKKISQKKTGMALPVGNFDEPNPPYAAKYPFNKVIETESGHTVEYDDTPGAERISIAHKSGTFIEMHPDGSLVIRTTGARHDITNGNQNEFCNGYNLRIDTTGNIYCAGNYTFKTDGNMKFDVAGDVVWDIKGNMTQVIGMSAVINATEDANIQAKNLNATGSSSTTIKGGGTTEQLNSNYNVSTGTYTVAASSVSFG